MRTRFRDRRDAGRALVVRLGHLRGADAVVLGLPRGGVPVAAEVARSLRLPLDVINVRKLGVPYQPELGMGAIGEDGVRVLNPEIVSLVRVTETELEAVETRERKELDRRTRRFRGGRPMLALEGRIAVVVDDGVATGGTAEAAVRVARAHGAARVVLAVPVGAPDTLERLATLADEVVSVLTPDDMVAVGYWYEDFSQTTDDEVVELLEQARRDQAARSDADPPPDLVEAEVVIPVDGRRLRGDLRVPAGAFGLVVFAHGSGSSRHSPRNRSVAAILNQAGIGTLLFDLLTEAEALDRHLVFDIPLLADRLVTATGWLAGVPDAAGLPVGYFGASTGAAAALWAAAEPAAEVEAVVSRGGRPDLALGRLGAVRAPTLLIVGSEDRVVLDLNQQAARALRCPHEVAVVAGATHLFEEPGTLTEAAGLARAWFADHLSPAAVTARR